MAAKKFVPLKARRLSPGVYAFGFTRALIVRNGTAISFTTRWIAFFSETRSKYFSCLEDAVAWCNKQLKGIQLVEGIALTARAYAAKRDAERAENQRKKLLRDQRRHQASRQK